MTEGPIRLKSRLLKNGNLSLYLDLCHNGQRRYEFLKMYLTPGKTKAEREENARVLQLANAVRAKRIVEFQNEEYGFDNKRNRKKAVRLLELVDELIATRKSPRLWMTLRAHLASFDKRDVELLCITPEWVERFARYLGAYRTRTGEPLAPNTRRAYLIKLSALFRVAMRRGLMTSDPSAGLELEAAEDAHREYLTIEEVRRIAAVQMPTEGEEATRRAFLFACLCGLRYSDVRSLTWAEVHEEDGRVRLIFTQVKTGGREYLDLSAQAAELMGVRGKPLERVFPELARVTNTATNRRVRRIAKAAGIDKHLSFHCSRHTFGTMMLSLDTDIYTVSKLLGHRSIQSTQVYTKIMDKKKREAVDKIPDIF